MSVCSVGSSVRHTGGRSSSAQSNVPSVSDLLRDLIRQIIVDADTATLRDANIKAIRLISNYESSSTNYDETAIVSKMSRYLASVSKSDPSAVSRAQTIAAQLIHLNVTKCHSALFTFLFALRGRQNALASHANLLPSSDLLLSTAQNLRSQSSDNLSLHKASKSLVPTNNRFPMSASQHDPSAFMSQPATGRILLSIVQGISVATTAAGIILPHPADDLSDQQCQFSGQNRRLNRLAGVGWLCGRLRLIADQLRSQAPTTVARTGAVSHQSQLPQLYQLIGAGIATAADMHLADYIRLLATIESRCSSMTSSTGSLPSDTAMTSLTPLRLETQLFAAGHQLRLLTGACETVAGILHRAPPNASASILTYLYQLYISSSDDELKQCAGSLLVAACRPLYRCINAWLSDGRVPFGDFFIYCDPSVGLERFWADRFQLRKDALPVFISESLAAKMLLIGKAIHYATTISAAAVESGDSDVVVPNLPNLSMTSTGEYAAEVAAATGLAFPSADTLLSDIDTGKLATGRSYLFTYVDAVYRQLARDLLAVVIGSGSRLSHNLMAIRAFLLMARGDFAVRLVQLAAPILDQPAERVFVPGLRNNVLDAALRSTVVEPCPSSFLAKQADRVDCRLLQASPRDCGWDVFRLEWRIDPRLAPVLSPDTMLSYARLSSLLVAMRHSHFALTSVWMSCRHQVSPPKKRERKGSAAKTVEPVDESNEELVKLRRSIFVHLYATAHELRTFVDQLHYYIYLEVVEPAFSKFRRYCASEDAGIDLDGVIAEHRQLVDSLLVRCLLQPQPLQNSNEVSTSDLLDHLRNILQNCHSLAAIANETAAATPATGTLQLYRSLLAKISLCQRTAREHVKALLSALSMRRDPAQRCLAFRIDSSGFYSRRSTSSCC